MIARSFIAGLGIARSFIAGLRIAGLFNAESFIAEYVIKGLCLFFRHVPFRNVQHFELQPPVGPLHDDDVLCRDLVAGFRGSSGDGNHAPVAGLLGGIPLFDDAGPFQKLIYSHLIRYARAGDHCSGQGFQTTFIDIQLAPEVPEPAFPFPIPLGLFGKICDLLEMFVQGKLVAAGSVVQHHDVV